MRTSYFFPPSQQLVSNRFSLQRFSLQRSLAGLCAGHRLLYRWSLHRRLLSELSRSSLSFSLDRPFSTVNDQGVTIDVWRQLRAYRSSLWSREARQLLPSFFIFSFILEFFPQFKNGEKPLFPILSFLFRSISQAVAILIRQAKKSFRKARAAYGGTRLGRAVFRIRATKLPIARNTF